MLRQKHRKVYTWYEQSLALIQIRKGITCFMINTICICGAGTMGSGIAQAVASAGFKP